ncbi:hypothetical protein [Roseobacter sp. HKCCA0434]|uniref:hypothetical protein n=1 Tax=Roseobacter sp. HKCCA0434 TaxID=3079297 RepID=UPI002905955F|nr:hypothetical protein [Roseobacter sp. HKCCA0434]
MEIYQPDWSKRGADIFQEIEKWRRSRILNTIENLRALKDDLDNRDIFDHGLFRSIRSIVGPQVEWAEKVGVSQATIGNYERSRTYPNSQIRRQISDAIHHFILREQERLGQTSNISGLNVDVAEANKDLGESALSAALTDFKFDSKSQQVIAVPFSKDVEPSTIAEMEQDRKDLTESLEDQAKSICESLSKTNIGSAARLAETIEKYRRECEKTRPNPRKLYRLGTIIGRASLKEDIIALLPDYDRIEIDGFVSDHQELMRLYYREALLKVQEIDDLTVSNKFELPASHDFLSIADKIDQAVDKDGNKIFDPEISIILRDIGNEIADLEGEEILAESEIKRETIKKRKSHAVKTGAILIGRFLIFSSLFIIVDPGVAVNTAGSIASILGLAETASPGLIQKYYEKMREALPFLPRFPFNK